MASPRGSFHRAFDRGVLRTIRGSLKRFVALATITALGVTMIIGLKAACVDLRTSADTFFDDQNLFDVRVQSTLGLTDEDVAALACLDGVENVEGGWSESVYTTVGPGSEKVDVKALSPTGMNAPVVLQGHLPTCDDQIAVTQRYLDESGLSLGDTLTFHGDGDGEDGSTEVFERKEYTIIATVLDPMDINAGEGSMSFRSSGGAQYSFFVLPSCVTSDAADAYTVAYLTVDGARDPLCYSDDYTDAVEPVKQSIEDAREEREAARGAGLRADANQEIDEQEADALSQLSDAEDQIDDAQAQLDSGRAQLDQGRSELSSQEASAHAQLADAQAQIDASYAQINAAQDQVDAGLTQLASGLGCDVGGIPAALAAQHDQLVAGRASAETSATMLSSLMGDAWPADEWARLSSVTSEEEAEAAATAFSSKLDPFINTATTSLDELITYVSSPEFGQAMDQVGNVYDNLPDTVKQRLDGLLADVPEGVRASLQGILGMLQDQMVERLTSVRTQMQSAFEQLKALAPGMAQIVAGEHQLSEAQAGYQRLVASRAQVTAARAEVDAGATQLSSERASALAQIADGWDQLDASASTLAEGQDELASSRATFEGEHDDALAQIADARDQVSDIPDAVWYVQDRSSLASYASVDSDASSIETIGTVIPIVFFVVAVLISLTTMTRMVEEERELIGLYKALGYSRGRILSKYVLYALAACAAGGLVGNVLGFVALPAIIFTIFSTMYALPGFLYGFDFVYALGSIAVFALGIVGATVLTCSHELRELPASLMRPKAPKQGARIFLERIGPVWRRLSFLGKVTARNIFRYKRRFLMTVLGIAGCTALLVTGFGIRDTVLSLPARQYGSGGVIGYDLMAVTSPDDLDAVAADLSSDDAVLDLQRVYVDQLTASYGGTHESVQLIVVPDGSSLDGYVRLVDDAGDELDPSAGTGAVITKNAEQVMGFSAGDELELQDSTLVEASTQVDGIALNYLGNTVFMTQSAYEVAFDATCEPNAVLARLTGSSDEQVAFADQLSQDGRMLSVVSTQKLVSDFSSAFTLINTVVYVIIVLAAALSFTVVFTLSNTNISERERELATIKVLGFKRPEVHRYINKETLILTGMGVVCGLPLGYALARSLTWILRMPSLYFDVVVDPATYVISAAFACAFTLIVNALTNRSLDRVDMVGALKSAE